MTITEAARKWLSTIEPLSSPSQLQGQEERTNFIAAYFGPAMDLEQITDAQLLEFMIDAEAILNSYMRLRAMLNIMNQLFKVADLKSFEFPKYRDAQKRLEQLRSGVDPKQKSKSKKENITTYAN